ncbi:MAG: Crp/Fnr family transcriptional regulator [Oscillospiraceae bacterium]|nr:Crp/Fnr family transcriptional regulator [Oscillospiraceae bacterium]
MEKYFSLMAKTPLFYGVRDHEIAAMLGCLGAAKRRYEKGQYILRRGETVGDMLLLAEGKLYVQKEDFWGNRSILGEILPGELYGEAYAVNRTEPLLHDVIAMEDSTVLFFDVTKTLTTCSTACRFHTLVIQNLFLSISNRNRLLEQKLDHMSMRTTREKLLSYLTAEAARQGSSSFTIPYNRQQLADYLSVDRSAMSNELSKMRKEGLLELRGSHFDLCLSNLSPES